MFISERRGKWCPREQSFDRIPTGWRIVIAGLIGSGTGLFILTMWSSGSKDEESSWNRTSTLEPGVQLLGRISGIEFSVEGRASVYCKNSGCSAITCTSIPESLDPGQVASEFIMQIFQVECPSTKVIEQLVFDSCTFPDNKLKRDWLSANLPIGWLTFRNCALTELPRGSFASSIFANTKSLDIGSAKIRSLRKWTFEELVSLNNLQIDDNIIHEAEYDLLRPVADSLEVLTLDGCIKDPRVLMNVTSGSPLARVQLVSIQRNTLPTITPEIFQAIPKVVSLYLGRCEIERIEPDALKAARSLLLLDLKHNLLTTLPLGLFASALPKPDFKVFMSENPWNCSCDFQWIQEMITDHPSVLREIPKCEAPASNALKYFTNAEFCLSATVATTLSSNEATSSGCANDEPTGATQIPATTTGTNPTSTDDNDTPSFVKFTCRGSGISVIERMSGRRLFSNEEWEYPSRFRDFFVKPLADGNVWINVRRRDPGVSLVWFTSEALQNDPPSSVHCARNVKGPLILTNLQRDRSYTICLLEELGEYPSPFDCLAMKTEAAFRTDTWLTNEDKATVLSISVSLLIVVGIISVLSSFLVIRRHPSLLKGSKRVVMVRKRSVEALVLPEGTRMNQRALRGPTDDSCGRRKPDPDYLIPLEVREWTEGSSPSEPRRKDSKDSRVSSRYSGGSYVSGIEPSPTELAHWRNNGRTRSYTTWLETDEPEDPPPLPPRRPTRRQTIPSLSQSIDSNRGNTYHDFSAHTNDVRSASSKLQFVDGIM